MSIFKAVGTVTEVSETVHIDAIDQNKCTLVLQTDDGEWPKFLAVDAFGDKTEGLAQLKGEKACVHFGLKSKKAKTGERWFTSVSFIKAEVGEPAGSSADEDKVPF